MLWSLHTSSHPVCGIWRTATQHPASAHIEPHLSHFSMNMVKTCLPPPGDLHNLTTHTHTWPHTAFVFENDDASTHSVGELKALVTRASLAPPFGYIIREIDRLCTTRYNTRSSSNTECWRREQSDWTVLQSDGCCRATSQQNDGSGRNSLTTERYWH